MSFANIDAIMPDNKVEIADILQIQVPEEMIKK